MALPIIILIYLILTYHVLATSCLMKLPENYNPRFKPTPRWQVLGVSVYVEIKSLLSIDEQKMTAELIVPLTYSWKDPLLDNNPGEAICYTGDPSVVWEPDVCLVKNVVSQQNIFLDRRNVICDNGNVTAFMTLRALVRFSVNVIDFPFDEEAIPFAVGSGTFDVSELNITIAGFSLATPFIQNNEWTLSRFTCEQDDRQEGFSARHSSVVLSNQVSCEFVVKRNSSPYIAFFCYPTMLVALLALGGILMPLGPQQPRGSKFHMALMASVGFGVMALTITKDLPKEDSGMPIIVRFYLNLMASVVAAAFFNGLALFFEVRARREKPFPCVKSKDSAMWFKAAYVTDKIGALVSCTMFVAGIVRFIIFKR